MDNKTVVNSQDFGKLEGEFVPVDLGFFIGMEGLAEAFFVSGSSAGNDGRDGLRLQELTAHVRADSCGF